MGVWIPEKLSFPGISQSLELNADNSWKQTLKSEKETISASGTYSVEKDELILTELETSMGSTSRKSAKDWKYIYKFIWVNDDSLQLTPNDAKMVNSTTLYKRKK